MRCLSLGGFENVAACQAVGLGKGSDQWAGEDFRRAVRPVSGRVGVGEIAP